MDFPEEFYNCGTREELFNLIRAKPKFNPCWLILIDFLWGRQSTRDWLEFYTTQGQLEGRYDELRSRERDEDETENFVRPAGEKQTLVFNDDQDIASKDSIYTDGRVKDMRHSHRENAINVSSITSHHD